MTPLTASHATGPAEPSVRELTLGDALNEAARECPDRVALIESRLDEAPARTWTNAQFRDQSEQVARTLLHRFEPGDRVAVWAHNIPEWAQLQFGTRPVERIPM